MKFLFLSAGKSSRMGIAKYSLDFFGKPWLLEQIERVQSALPLAKIEIVVKSEDKISIDELIKNKSITLIENCLVDAHPHHSVLLGCQNMAGHVGVFVSPIDIPISPQALTKMIEKLIFDRPISIQPNFRNKGGHPIWMSSELVKRFIEAPERLDFFLRKFDRKKIEVTNPEVLLNLNTPHDWQEYLKSQNSNSPRNQSF